MFISRLEFILWGLCNSNYWFILDTEIV